MMNSKKHQSPMTMHRPRREKGLQWALGVPEIGRDKPVKRLTPAIRDLCIRALEYALSDPDALAGRRFAAAKALRGMRTQLLIEQIEQQGELQAAARARLAELEQQAL